MTGGGKGGKRGFWTATVIELSGMSRSAAICCRMAVEFRLMLPKAAAPPCCEITILAFTASSVVETIASEPVLLSATGAVRRASLASVRLTLCFT